MRARSPTPLRIRLRRMSGSIPELTISSDAPAASTPFANAPSRVEQRWLAEMRRLRRASSERGRLRARRNLPALERTVDRFPLRFARGVTNQDIGRVPVRNGRIVVDEDGEGSRYPFLRDVFLTAVAVLAAGVFLARRSLGLCSGGFGGCLRRAALRSRRLRGRSLAAARRRRRRQPGRGLGHSGFCRRPWVRALSPRPVRLRSFGARPRFGFRLLCRRSCGFARPCAVVGLLLGFDSSDAVAAGPSTRGRRDDGRLGRSAGTDELGGGASYGHRSRALLRRRATARLGCGGGETRRFGRAASATRKHVALKELPRRPGPRLPRRSRHDRGDGAAGGGGASRFRRDGRAG